MLFQSVTASFLKFIKQGRCPVGTIDFIGVVEEGVGIGGLVIFEGCGKSRQVMCHGGTVEMVDDIAFAARSSAFYLLQGSGDVDGVDSPMAFGCLPGEPRVGDRLVQGYACSLVRIGNKAVQIGVGADAALGQDVDGGLFPSVGCDLPSGADHLA